MQIIGIVPTQGMVDVFERALIRAARNQGLKLTNMEDGGGTIQMTDEIRRKIGDANRGRRHTEETKKLIANSRRGYCHTEEARRKMADAKKGKKRVTA
jgi:hypothetical protein